MNLYTLQTPKQWLAGYTGTGENKKPFYFNCGYCDAHEPIIHGFIGPSHTEIAVLKQPGSVFIRKALMCHACWTKANGAFFPPC
jgi:hypothetical protein